METEEQLTPAALLEALAILLDRIPDARIGARSEHALFVELPVSLSVAGHAVLTGRSPVDLVVGDDLAELIAGRVQGGGASPWEMPRSRPG